MYDFQSSECGLFLWDLNEVGCAVLGNEPLKPNCSSKQFQSRQDSVMLSLSGF